MAAPVCAQSRSEQSKTIRRVKLIEVCFFEAEFNRENWFLIANFKVLNYQKISYQGDCANLGSGYRAFCWQAYKTGGSRGCLAERGLGGDGRLQVSTPRVDLARSGPRRRSVGRNVGAGDKVLLSGHGKGPGPRVFRDAHPIRNTARTERVKGLGLHYCQ